MLKKTSFLTTNLKLFPIFLFFIRGIMIAERKTNACLKYEEREEMKC